MGQIITIPIWVRDDDEPPKDYIFRDDGRVEWMCEHGVGHTIAVQPRFNFESWKDRWGTHGCDGCCLPVWKLKD